MKLIGFITRAFDHRGQRITDARYGIGNRCCIAIVLLLTGLQPAMPAATVRGHQDEIQVQADNASAREILDALSSKFNMTYKLPPNLNVVRTGLYAGKLRDVLKRLLDGNDYIITSAGDRLEIVVIGPSQLTATVAPNQVAPKVTPHRGTAASPPVPALSSYLPNSPGAVSAANASP
jgi:hypothetical protein